ncbi:MAG: phosphotransferase [Clostridiales bacterium]|nr:phosphotransferase [Clostridiales bacterium]
MDHLIDALNSHFSAAITRLTHLRDGGCTSYVAQGEGGKYLVKLVPDAFRATALRSADVLARLAEAGFPAPRPVRARSGGPHAEIDGRLAMMFSFIEGRELDEGERLADVGALTGRLHAALEGFEGLLPAGRAFFIDRYLSQLAQKGYPDGKLSAFRAIGDALWERVESLPRGFCHGDLHRGNLLVAPDGEIYLLDFDTACLAFPMYDVAVMCDHTDYFAFRARGYGAAMAALREFYRGYQTRRGLTDRELAAFPDLIGVRHFQLQATILEIHGMNCVNEQFIDRQLDWLEQWMAQCERRDRI